MDQPAHHETGFLQSLTAFKGVIWGLFALCVVALSTRISIRLVCFRKLFVEDYLMIVVLGVMLGNAILCQIRMDLVYLIDAVGNGDIDRPPDFREDMPKALHAVLANTLLCILGIWAVKYNFLLFFYRLGSKVRLFRIGLWVVVAITTACLAVVLGTTDYPCTTSPVDFLMTQCSTEEGIQRETRATIINCTFDIFTDVLIIIFPISILWKVRIPLRKKIVLACFFGMILVTIGITLVRATVRHGRVASINTQAQNMNWVWFWFTIEFVTAFVVACTASFRSLFVQIDRSRNGSPLGNQANAARRPSTPRSPKRRPYDTLLNTILSLEGENERDRERYLLDSEPPPYQMSQDASYENRWSGQSKAETDRTRSIETSSFTQPGTHNAGGMLRSDVP
ncbi:uncharacterized protein PG986_006475 [Apiospora aurea]|uniref:Rhodopsin domain-containing protein n=1 Tax=Apiospora aurea TaxID=335848 RepID=A0ABR1QKV8_9PEZI